MDGLGAEQLVSISAFQFVSMSVGQNVSDLFWFTGNWSPSTVDVMIQGESRAEIIVVRSWIDEAATNFYLSFRGGNRFAAGGRQ
jgi:hypothetical protein